MARIYYHATPVDWRKERKYKFLDEAGSISGIEWREITPDAKQNWLTEGMRDEFETFISIGNKDAKTDSQLGLAIFASYSRGVETTRDDWVFSFKASNLSLNVSKMIAAYNEQVTRWHAVRRDRTTLDDFVDNDPTKIKWSSSLKLALLAGKQLIFDASKIRRSSYHPFSADKVYFDETLIHRRGKNQFYFPSEKEEKENQLFVLNGVGSEKNFSPLAANSFVNLSFYGGGTALQCFPFYTYEDDGTNRRENITDWALKQFRERYRTEQNRTEQNRTEQNRTEQNRTEQNRTEQNRNPRYRSGFICGNAAGNFKMGHFPLHIRDPASP